MNEPKVTDFKCPVCKAEPGQPCVMRGGLPGQEFHLPRQDKYIRAFNKWQFEQKEIRLARTFIVERLREAGHTTGHELRHYASSEFFAQALGQLIDSGEVVRHGEHELALAERAGKHPDE